MDKNYVFGLNFKLLSLKKGNKNDKTSSGGLENDIALWYNGDHHTKEKENLPMIRKLLCLFVVLALVLSIPIPGYAASSMKASDDCVAVIKAFEGFSGTPYRDTDGHYTIGYGTRCPDSKVEYYTNNPMSREEAALMRISA